ncbi:hypothetical protein B0H14DRAFT_2642411 [Mycena olivaceomarginata]|nr:hypothetical protein B0H14DRAFT_2642411 [Mycena olivaceomarginata]
MTATTFGGSYLWTVANKLLHTRCGSLNLNLLFSEGMECWFSQSWFKSPSITITQCVAKDRDACSSLEFAGDGASDPGYPLGSIRFDSIRARPINHIIMKGALELASSSPTLIPTMRAFCLSPAILFVSLAGLSSAHQQFTVSRPSVSNDGVARTMATWSYVDCGLDTDVIQLKSFEISPDPPQPGKDLTITVKGHAAERIGDGAYADVTVKLGVIKLIQYGNRDWTASVFRLGSPAGMIGGRGLAYSRRALVFNNSNYHKPFWLFLEYLNRTTENHK